MFSSSSSSSSTTALRNPTFLFASTPHLFDALPSPPHTLSFSSPFNRLSLRCNASSGRIQMANPTIEMEDLPLPRRGHARRAPSAQAAVSVSSFQPSISCRSFTISGGSLRFTRNLVMRLII